MHVGPPGLLHPLLASRSREPRPPAHRQRAGKETINSMYGTRVAVLAGDFLFAQSSWFLANLDNLEVRNLCLREFD